MGVYRSGYINKGASQEEIIEILGGIMHNLNEILNRLSSDNIKSIETDRTKIKSSDSLMEFSGPMLIMRDSNKRERLKIGRKGNDFHFTLYNIYGEAVLTTDEYGNLVIKE